MTGLTLPVVPTNFNPLNNYPSLSVKEEPATPMYELVLLRSRLKKLEKKLELEIVENLNFEEACKVYEEIKYLNELIRERRKSIHVQYNLN